jgi:hypothetical protein
VRNAPPGSTIELVLNGTPIGSATAARDGSASLPVNLSSHIKKSETDVHVYADVCGETARRVFLEEPGVPPPAPNTGCTRTELVGLFVLRGVTTLLVDVAGSRPAVWLRQGPAPAEWLAGDQPDYATSSTRRPSPTGLVLFAGAGLARFGDTTTQSCGNVTTCEGKDGRRDFAVGAAFWITRFLGIQGTYLRPGKLNIAGSATGYTFTDRLDAHVLTVSANGGIPIGPVRIYGQFGRSFHRATSSLSETIDERTIALDQGNVTLPGGTQSTELKTEGWGWQFGGGIEGWVKPSFALYAEAGRSALKGSERSNGAGKLDERATYVVGGFRIRLWR